MFYYIRWEDFLISYISVQECQGSCCKTVLTVLLRIFWPFVHQRGQKAFPQRGGDCGGVEVSPALGSAEPRFGTGIHPSSVWTPHLHPHPGSSEGQLWCPQHWWCFCTLHVQVSCTGDPQGKHLFPTSCLRVFWEPGGPRSWETGCVLPEVRVCVTTSLQGNQISDGLKNEHVCGTGIVLMFYVRWNPGMCFCFHTFGDLKITECHCGAGKPWFGWKVWKLFLKQESIFFFLFSTPTPPQLYK